MCCLIMCIPVCISSSIADVANLSCMLLQKLGLSTVNSFLTGPPVGPTSTVHFLAMADLGHTTLDSADEYDYDESTDILNYAPEGTPERVSLLPPAAAVCHNCEQCCSAESGNECIAIQAQTSHMHVIHGCMLPNQKLCVSWSKLESLLCRYVHCTLFAWNL